MSDLKYSKTKRDTGRVRHYHREYDALPEKARWLLHENEIKLHKRMPVKKDIERRFYSGVEALRYLGPARKFILERFSITTNDLDVLLYLYPYNYFTKSDYNRIAKPFIKCRGVNTYVKNGLVTKTFTKEDLTTPTIDKKKVEDVYCLTVKGKMVVSQFYNIVGQAMKPYFFEKLNFSKSETKNNLMKDLLREMKQNLE